MQKSYSFGESIARLKRLHQYQQNVSRKIEPIIKRLAPRLSEMLFYIDLPSDCMTSLARIGQAARNGERWAIKCKFNYYQTHYCMRVIKVFFQTLYTF